MNGMQIIQKPDELKKDFLELADKMIEIYGLKATLLLLTENFLDEEEVGRKDGLIDIPIRITGR